MYNNNSNGYNPFAQNMSFNNFGAPPKYEVITVYGKEGAEALQMAPNSKAILLDERPNINLIWLAQTDGAGYKTVTPFTYAPYVEKPPVDTNELSDRVANIEQMMTSLVTTMEELRNEKSNVRGSDHRQNNKPNNKPKQQSD